MSASWGGSRECDKPDPGLFDGPPTRAQYERVKKGDTGYAEVVEIQFDPARVSYWDLLAKFFKIHDPRTPNKQGVDEGTQYRSEIFTHSPRQAQEAKLAIQAAEASGLWKPTAEEIASGIPEKFSTQISRATKFHPAYEEHQNYLDTNVDKDFCHMPRFDWVLPSQEEAKRLVAEQKNRIASGASASFTDRFTKPQRSPGVVGYIL